MRIKKNISWLVTRVQQALIPFLDECLPSPLTEQEKHLVVILELVQI